LLPAFTLGWLKINLCAFSKQAQLQKRNVEDFRAGVQKYGLRNVDLLLIHRPLAVNGHLSTFLFFFSVFSVPL
jgi:hypothetical protein